MTPVVENRNMALTQAEKRPMAQRITFFSLIFGAAFVVITTILAILAR